MKDFIILLAVLLAGYNIAIIKYEIYERYFEQKGEEQ